MIVVAILNKYKLRRHFEIFFETYIREMTIFSTKGNKTYTLVIDNINEETSNLRLLEEGNEIDYLYLIQTNSPIKKFIGELFSKGVLEYIEGF